MNKSNQNNVDGNVYLVLGEPSADGSGLLGTEIERQQLLLLVSLSESGLLLLRNHCQNSGDRDPHDFAENEKSRETVGQNDTHKNKKEQWLSI